MKKHLSLIIFTALVGCQSIPDPPRTDPARITSLPTMLHEPTDMPDAWHRSLSGDETTSSSMVIELNPSNEIRKIESLEQASTPERSSTNTGPATPRSKPKPDFPYGTPVPSKPGLVKSPYTNEGFVDVRGFPPGMEAMCPYTGKVFLVP